VGQTVTVAAAAERLAPVGSGGLPYRTSPDTGAAAAPATAVAIPYFQWDNRDGGPMRVWLPLREPSEAGAASNADHEPDRVPRPRQIP
jgi:DUF1680 family protein